MSSTSCSRQEPPARSWPRAASSRQRSSSCRGIPTERSATRARGPSRGGASSSLAKRRFGVCVRVGDGICQPGRLGVQVKVGVRTRRRQWSVRGSRIADDLQPLGDARDDRAATPMPVCRLSRCARGRSPRSRLCAPLVVGARPTNGAAGQVEDAEANGVGDVRECPGVPHPRGKAPMPWPFADVRGWGMDALSPTAGMLGCSAWALRKPAVCALRTTASAAPLP
jgi:hypothetical protein